MSLSNKEIAQIFTNISDMLEIKGESRFRYLSYRRAGETLSDLPRDLDAYAADDELTEIPGIGDSIAEKIREILETGTLQYYEDLKDEVPLGVLEMMRVNGVGPKKAKLFWTELNITSVPELKQAAAAGRLRELSGMGEKSEQKIIEGIESLERRSGRTPLGDAKPAAERILSTLMELDDALVGTIAGSIRRGKPTIGDVDILIASDDAAPIMETFVNLDSVDRILNHGETKSSVELRSGLQVDVRVLPRSRWGTAIQYFTGSQAHNIKIREIARKEGYSLNEDALSPIDDAGNIIDDADKLYFEDEADLYEQLGLRWIAPEMREDTGEINAARENTLPNLITLDDIQGDLHMHTTYSDGGLSIREMADAARERGRKYIVITDHSQASYQAGGLKPDELLKQQDDVREVDAAMGDNFHVLHGVEMDILGDGSMDYDDDILEQLDFVIASPHAGLRQDRETFTRRLLNAIENPHVDLIGHPTGQLIGRRDPAKVDMDTVIQAAAEHGTALEINAHPARLDLEAQYVRHAIENGVLIAINTDAHSAQQMDLMEYGVITGRRGWLTAESVINAWSFDKFIDWVRNRNA